MVMVVNVKVVSRADNESESCAFQHFVKYHAELRGTTLFLYQDDTQHTVSKQLHLLLYLRFYQ